MGVAVVRWADVCEVDGGVLPTGRLRSLGERQISGGVLAAGRMVQGFIDLLVETDFEVLVIDHKSTARPPEEWAQ